MSSFNPSRYLANSSGSDPFSLGLTVFSGVFAEAWKHQPSFYNDTSGVIAKMAGGGNKAFQILQFAEPPDAVQQYQAGDAFPGQQYELNDVTITVENYIRAGYSVRRDDMRVSHVEIMTKLAQAAARKIHTAMDQRIINLACQAARATSATKGGLTVHNGGNRVTQTGGSVAAAFPASTTGAANLRAKLRELALAQDEDNCPAEGRRLWMRHDMRNVLLFDNTAQVFSRDYNGSNDQQSRQVITLEGYEVQKTLPQATLQNGVMPDSNVTSASGLPSKYHANFAVGASTGTPVALALSRGSDGDAAVACGIWEGPFTQAWYDEETLTYHVDVAVLPGFGIMSPWLAGTVEAIT